MHELHSGNDAAEAPTLVLANGNFIAWAGDAHALAGDRDVAWLANLYLVPAPGIDAFDSTAPVVAAMRGCGKSLLMRRRAARLLQSKDNNVLLRTVPPHINEIAKDYIVVSPEQGAALTSGQRWEALWLVALLGNLAVRAMREAKAYKDYKATREADAYSDGKRQQRGRSSSSRAASSEDDLIAQFIAQETDAAKRRKSVVESTTTGWSITSLLAYVWHAQATPHSEFIGPLVQMLLNRGLDRDKPQLDACIHVMANLLGHHATKEQRFFAFVDAVDEAFCVEDEHGNRTPLGARPFVDATAVWVAAQKGLLFASHRIRAIAANATIVASIRGETIRQLTQPDIDRLGGANGKIYDVVFTEVRYTDSQLAHVFDVNVERTPVANLASPTSPDSATKLFGFKQVWHGSVPFRREKVLNLICRHTYGSPRDLVVLTKAMIDAVPAKARLGSARIMLDALDLAAAKTCIDWINSAVPRLAPAMLQVIASLAKNVYTRAEVEALEGQARVPGLFHGMLEAGLVGIPESVGQDCFLKFFSPRADAVHAQVELPRFFALHPALSALLSNLRRVEHAEELRTQLGLSAQALVPFAYDTRFVVGNGYPCPTDVDGTMRLRCDLDRWELTVFPPDNGHLTIRLDDGFAASKGITTSALQTFRYALACIVLIAILERKSECIASYEEIEKRWLLLTRIVDVPHDFARTLDNQSVSGSTLHDSEAALLAELGLRLHFQPKFNSVALAWAPDGSVHSHWIPVKFDELNVVIPNQRSDRAGGPVVAEN